MGRDASLRGLMSSSRWMKRRTWSKSYCNYCELIRVASKWSYSSGAHRRTNGQLNSLNWPSPGAVSLLLLLDAWADSRRLIRLGARQMARLEDYTSRIPLLLRLEVGLLHTRSKNLRTCPVFHVYYQSCIRPFRWHHQSLTPSPKRQRVSSCESRPNPPFRVYAEWTWHRRSDWWFGQPVFPLHLLLLQIWTKWWQV